MTDLLDANVWLPLSWHDHVHHARATAYWDQESAERFAFCRVTALALLRLLTNPTVLGGDALPGLTALRTVDEWRRLPEVRMLADPPGLDLQLEAICASHMLRGGAWTDAYLAAFAMSGNLRLVTFDRGFRRYAGLNLLLL